MVEGIFIETNFCTSNSDGWCDVEEIYIDINFCTSNGDE